jgi:diguanylate cyclase (GGDEF)-like protein
MVSDGRTIGGYGIYTDISGRKMREEHLAYVSTHDDLTGLYNRRYFEQAIRDMNLEVNLPLAVVMVDVNGLKMINDAFGHPRGDELLKLTSLEIRRYCRPQDVVARIGGDEFAIIMPAIETEAIEQTVKAMRQTCNALMVEEIPVSVAIGWANKEVFDVPVESVLKDAEDYMHKYKLMEGPSVRGKAVFTMVRTLHEKNKREEQHSIRVGELSYRLGKALNLSSRDLGDLKMMGLLHDVGKIAIDQKILNKESHLTNEEYTEIKKHPEIGYRILSAVNEMSEIAVYVLAHHERWDGGGYPRGLKGEEIPYLARIITVVDAFDAMTSDRAYRKEMSQEKAFAELKRCAGQQFDPDIVDAFIHEMESETYFS